MNANTAAHTQCIVAGGGPAGMMTGYLLARAGIGVTVLEKHADFLRDFRGDTIHPSTMDNLAELGLLDAFLRLPHQEVRYAEVEIGGERVRGADFGRLSTRCKFIAFIPQWDFLNFMAAQAKAFPRLQPVDGDRGRRSDPRRRSHRRRRGPLAVGRAAPHRRSRHRRRRPAFDAAAGGRPQGEGPRRADGRAVVQAAARPRGAGRGARPHQGRRRAHHARPRRLLAVRLHHPQGHGRRGQGPGPGGLPRPRGWVCRPGGGAAHRQPRRREAADRDGGPPGDLAQARPAVHRRRRPCHVARRRCRHQPRHPGRHCRRQPAGRTAAARHPGRRRPAQGPAAPELSHAGHAGLPDRGAEPRHRSGSQKLARSRGCPGSYASCSGISRSCRASRHGSSASGSARSTWTWPSSMDRSAPGPSQIDRAQPRCDCDRKAIRTGRPGWLKAAASRAR